MMVVSGGAGGKGTWGIIGEVMDESDFAVKDQQDPNYESEEDETVSAVGSRIILQQWGLLEK